MTNFTIDIVSDTVCPWCYIGYRRLQAAIAEHIKQHPTDSFSISWHPFQLSPEFPKGRSIDKLESYHKKLGLEQTEVVFDRLRSAAKGTGITFSFEGRTGNTLDSHRLIELAKQKDDSVAKRSGYFSNLQTRVVEELFQDYFEREQDITSYEVLRKAAGRAGLDEDEVNTFLASDALAKDVESKARASRDGDINGVPQFTINGVFTVEGAQEPAAFLMLFKRLKRREENRVKAVL